MLELRLWGCRRMVGFEFFGVLGILNLKGWGLQGGKITLDESQPYARMSAQKDLRDPVVRQIIAIPAEIGHLGLDRSARAPWNSKPTGWHCQLLGSRV